MQIQLERCNKEGVNNNHIMNIYSRIFHIQYVDLLVLVEVRLALALKKVLAISESVP